MKVKPSLASGLVLVVGYAALFLGLLLAFGVDMSDPFADAESARSVAIVLAIASVVMAGITAVIGWWGPVLREKRRLSGWLRFVPWIMLAAIAVATDYDSITSMDSDLLVWIAVSALLVGFAEELTFRGLAIVGFRGGMGEIGVYVLSTAAFAVFHLTNVVAGADFGPTIFQVVVAFVGGTFLYLTRRAAGTILAAMAVHTLWDFSSFTADAYALSIVSLVTAVLVFLGFIISHKKAFADAEAAEAA